MQPAVSSLQTAFFEYVFPEDTRGFVCICTATPKKAGWQQRFFAWPTEKDKLLAYIEQAAPKRNVWFCVNLLSKEERRKEYCLPTNLVWSDLDECDPISVQPEPQCIIESSPGRFQALWRLDETLDPYEAEHLSKRLAYAYLGDGADKGGWDLTQLLRVPFTKNFKYADDITDPPLVKLERAAETLVAPSVFKMLPEIETFDLSFVQMPEVSDLPDADETVLRYYPGLHRTAFHSLYTEEPDEDWSKSLWRIINISFEAGMTAPEAFAVALSAKCNKYARDKRPISHLWQEVVRAEQNQAKLAAALGKYEPLRVPELLTSEEASKLPSSFVEDYCSWAEAATDATPQYHELCAFMLMSMLAASGLKLNTSYGALVPNLWGMILGESTLTRKTTAMKLALGFVEDIDRDLVVATDGSAEGLLSALSDRPHMVSVYYRDEVSGLFDGMARKDYMSGMAEAFTQLYDVPPFYTRKLRKETITISYPVFIFYGGGIRDTMYSHITENMILSGFVPRFLFVCGDTDLKRIRPTGPADASATQVREALLGRLRKLHANYTRTADIEIAGQHTTIPATTEVYLESTAWERYGEIEMQMIEAANSSALAPLALPCYERLSRSLLKMAMLLAAGRQDPIDNTIQVLDQDIATASKYIQKWTNYTVDMLLNSGRNTTQRLLDNILGYIRRNPGVPRGRLMTTYRISAREMDEIQRTLEDRGQVKLTKQGKTVLFHAREM